MTLIEDLNQLIEKLIAENTMAEVAATELKDLFAEVKEVGGLLIKSGGKAGGAAGRGRGRG